MADPSPPEDISAPQISSARRRPPPPSRVLAWVAASVAVLIGMMVLLRPRHAESPPVPTPTPVPTVVSPIGSTTTPTPTVTPTPTPTSTPLPPTAPTPTATPFVMAAPTRRPRSTPPHLEPPECLSYRWSIGANTPSLGHNFVEIEVTNRCDRDLGKEDMWFVIRAYRQGGLVHTVRAGPFDDARRGQTVTIGVDLPGSMDWYDEVRVGPLRR